MQTFVVRLWVAAAGDPAPGASALRGVLEEVATGETVTFASGEALLAALERAALRRAQEQPTHHAAS